VSRQTNIPVPLPISADHVLLVHC